MQQKKIKILPGVLVSDVGAEGMALGRVDNRVVFFPFGAPGDVVNIKVVKQRKNYIEGIIDSFEKESELRVAPFCEHFGVCGGCKWQHLPYSYQLQFKQKQVEDAMIRIGKLNIPVIKPIIGSEKSQYYRNKLEFTFSDNRWLTAQEIHSGQVFKHRNSLGFHIPGMFDKVIDIHTCYLQPEISNQIRNRVREFAIENSYTFFSLRNQTGFLRNLMIRNTSDGDFMVAFSFFENDLVKINQILEFTANEFPQIKSLVYFINSKRNDSLGDLNFVLFKGQDHIIENMAGLKFKINPKSFYQTNSEQAYQLYKTVLDFAQLKGKETVYDLYTGTGTIACFIAGHCKRVTGIEYVDEAIQDAWRNATLNQISNTDFVCGDIKDVFKPDFINVHGKPQVVITDPPRAGMHPGVIENLLFAKPEKIVYVSCNPATQARDLSLLSGEYSITEIQPVDMFPHTHHVENVVLLMRK